MLHSWCIRFGRQKRHLSIGWITSPVAQSTICVLTFELIFSDPPSGELIPVVFLSVTISCHQVQLPSPQCWRGNCDYPDHWIGCVTHCCDFHARCNKPKLSWLCVFMLCIKTVGGFWSFFWCLALLWYLLAVYVRYRWLNVPWLMGWHEVGSVFHQLHLDRCCTSIRECRLPFRFISSI